jgi:hypothetical protein
MMRALQQVRSAAPACPMDKMVSPVIPEDVDRTQADAHANPSRLNSVSLPRRGDLAQPTADVLSSASICACMHSNNPASVLKLERRPLWMCSISPCHSVIASGAAGSASRHMRIKKEAYSCCTDADRSILAESPLNKELLSAFEQQSTKPVSTNSLRGKPFIRAWPVFLWIALDRGRSRTLQ